MLTEEPKLRLSSSWMSNRLALRRSIVNATIITYDPGVLTTYEEVLSSATHARSYQGVRLQNLVSLTDG